MPLPEWSEVRDSLVAAIRAALPLQIRAAGGDPIAGIGLHMDAYSGAAGLYLLPESAARDLSPTALANIGDWPISTDWDGTTDHAEAFEDHWGRWDEWFYAQKMDATGQPVDATDEEVMAIGRGLLRVACEAMHRIESEGLLDSFPLALGFRIVIAEHDEPDELAVERYDLFRRTGTIRNFGDDV